MWCVCCDEVRVWCVYCDEVRVWCVNCDEVGCGVSIVMR